MQTIKNFLRLDERVTTSGQPSEAQLALLAQDGCTAIINLALHDDPRYSLPDEPSTVAALGMAYTHIPVLFGAPFREDFALFAAAMQCYSTHRLHVHCAANYRVSCFIGLYRVIHENWAVAPAFAPMLAIWTPDSVWREFVRALLLADMGQTTLEAFDHVRT